MFYDLYCSLCKEKDEKPSRAAENIGINRSTVSQWKTKYEQGIDITPNSEVLKKISDYFNVPVDYLLGKEKSLTASKKEAPINDEDLKFALWGNVKDEITEEELADVRAFAQFIAQRKTKKRGTDDDKIE